MKHVLDEDLIYEILSVVEEIPEGCVATYGQIARLIGREKNSRLVGKVLSMAEYYGQYPCHRVVGREPCGKAGAGLERAGGAAARGRRGAEKKRLCGFEKVSVGLLRMYGKSGRNS